MKKRRFQRCLSLLLAASMAIPTIGNFTVFAGEVPSGENWTGCTACSEESPHMISTKADLDHIRTHLGGDGHVNGYFKLANDIIFEKADFEEGGDFYRDGCGWLPIGDDGTIGTGHDEHEPAQADIWLDGDGHTISGLEMHSYPGDVVPDPRPAGRSLAFVTNFGNGTIQNLTFDNMTVTSYNNGALVYATATADSVVRNVNLTNSTLFSKGWRRKGVFAGTVSGLVENVTVKNCRTTDFEPIEGKRGNSWGYSFFSGCVDENATLRNITVEGGQFDCYAYGTLFCGKLCKGATVENITIRNLKTN